MANSRYEYVKQFEKENYLLQDCYIIIRVDGKSFHKFSSHYNFNKPNDEKALEVMNLTAEKIMNKYDDILMAYGDSDEYSFLLRKSCSLFDRREMKLITLFSSLMSCYYIYYWQKLIGQLDEDHLPLFDARAILYPNFNLVRDYFSWRQVDCHINNLYNTTFWNLVKLGLTPQESEKKLMGTISSDKHEILFKECDINYNNEPEMFKKGTILVKQFDNYEMQSNNLTIRQKQRYDKKLKKQSIIVKYHNDIINDNEWWNNKPWLKD
ncbi:unnamed protein product [Candida verbasci]|uniref:tRNA(His) guanylyltransferase n=1 Tax=Candida verbasci TaxID=1227364 RepID=A0A9W4TYV2_9ASCO|nr:unnamed protein product [Candida verbasci]